MRRLHIKPDLHFPRVCPSVRARATNRESVTGRAEVKMGFRSEVFDTFQPRHDRSIILTLPDGNILRPNPHHHWSASEG